MIINTSDLARVSLRQIRQAHPNVSLPRNPTDEHLNPLGYAVLHPTERPEGDVVTEGTPSQGEDGKWYQTWEVREYTPEEAAEALEQAKARKVWEINDAYRAEVEPLTAEYPNSEPLSWAHQDTESRAYLAWHADGEQGDPPETPVLNAILAGRNGSDGTETLLALCQAVQTNAQAFIQAQALTGKRQRLVKGIWIAQSIAEVEAVEWAE